VIPVMALPATDSVAVPVTTVPFVSVTVAVIVVVPVFTPVAEPELLTIVPTPVFDEVQTATDVRFPVVPPE
jgi:hypothetical protein